MRCRGWMDGRALATVTTGAILVVGLAGADMAGLRFNATHSMPVGLWRMVPDRAPLRRGEIVVVCLPDTALARVGAARGYLPSGSCPGGSEPLVKPIAATAGDVVAVSAAGVAVNGQPVHDTASSPRTALGGL